MLVYSNLCEYMKTNSELPRQLLFDYQLLCSIHECTKKCHIFYAIYVHNVTCKVPGCLYAAYDQYRRPDGSF